MPNISSIPSAQQLRDAGRKASAASHLGTIRSFYPFWDVQYRPFLLQAVAALPAERFDFKPLPEMFTAHQIVVHIAECERGWIHGVLEGEAVEDWVVPHKDPTQGWVTMTDLPNHEALFAALDRWLDAEEAPR